MTISHKTASRVLQHVHHGGRILPDDAPRAEELAAERVRVSLMSEVLPGASLDDEEVSTAFDYLFPELADAFPEHHLTGDPAEVTAALAALGRALMEDPVGATDPTQRPADSTIPAIYTYWGQFIDHDVTANSDSNNAVSDVTVDPLQVVPRSVCGGSCATCASHRSTSTRCTATARSRTATRRWRGRSTTASSYGWAGSRRPTTTAARSPGHVCPCRRTTSATSRARGRGRRWETDAMTRT
jgi:hypothetical protein